MVLDLQNIFLAKWKKCCAWQKALITDTIFYNLLFTSWHTEPNSLPSKREYFHAGADPVKPVQAQSRNNPASFKLAQWYQAMKTNKQGAWCSNCITSVALIIWDWSRVYKIASKDSTILRKVKTRSLKRGYLHGMIPTETSPVFRFWHADSVYLS